MIKLLNFMITLLSKNLQLLEIVVITLQRKDNNIITQKYIILRKFICVTEWQVRRNSGCAPQ